MNLYPIGQAFEGESLDYNWSGWKTLADYLSTWGVDTSEMKGMNDGDPICAATCRKIADALDAHRSELPIEHQQWLEGHAAEWRRLSECGGCEQH